MRWVLGALVLAGAALLAACADDAPNTSPPPTTAHAAVGEPLPPELAVTVEYIPNLAVLRRLEITLANGLDVPVEITGLSYRSPWVDPGPPWAGEPTVAAGRALAQVFQLGEATCPPGDGEETFVDITVTDGARSWHGTYAVPDPERLVRLTERECGQRAVLEVVDLALHDEPSVDGQVLTTSIEATRRTGRDPITITQVDGSILFQLRPDGPDGALARLGPDTDRATIPLEVRTTRCDAHAVSQSQLSYRFPVFVRLGDGEPTYLYLEPGPGLRAGLEALVQECLEREGSGIPVN